MKTSLSLLLVTTLILSSCDTIDLYEKNAVIPGHSWKSDYQPEFAFTIKDTTVPYRVYLVLRHNERYAFNNIWLNLYSQPPGDTVTTTRHELKLATQKKWLGSGVDDIYEHRIPLTPEDKDVFFPRTGEYKFRVAHVMRQDPLDHVMNVGLRIEKKP